MVFWVCVWWMQVGESAETATVREVKEETNLDLVALEQVLGHLQLPSCEQLSPLSRLLTLS